jgi:hypothetical protein
MHDTLLPNMKHGSRCIETSDKTNICDARAIAREYKKITKVSYTGTIQHGVSTASSVIFDNQVRSGILP